MSWQIIIVALILITSTATVLEKFTLKKEHALQYLTLLSTLILIFSLPLVFLGKINFTIHPALWMLIALPAISHSLAALFFDKSLRHLDISQVLPMMNLSTLITVVAAFLIFGEKLNSFQILGIVFLIIGAYSLEAGSLTNLFNPIKTLVRNFASKHQQFIFYSILLYSIAYLLDKWLLTQVPILTYFFINILYSALFYLILTFGLYEGFTDLKTGFAAGGKLILPISLFFLVSSLIGGEILKEKHLIYRAATAIFMLLGASIVFK